MMVLGRMRERKRPLDDWGFDGYFISESGWLLALMKTATLANLFSQSLMPTAAPDLTIDIPDATAE
jgi:hypothetical protein